MGAITVAVFVAVICTEINPVLCKGEQSQISVNFTCDDTGTLYADDNLIGTTASYTDVFVGKIPLNSSWVAVKCHNKYGPGGLIVSLATGLVTNDEDWMCSWGEQSDSSNWVTGNGDNGTTWMRPTAIARNTGGVDPWGISSAFPKEAHFIWYNDLYREGTFYCKAEVNSSPTTQSDCPVCLPCDVITEVPAPMTTEPPQPKVVTKMTIEELIISKRDREELEETTEAEGAGGVGAVFVFFLIGELCLIVLLDLTSFVKSARYGCRSVSQFRKRLKKKKSNTSSFETTTHALSSLNSPTAV